MILDALHRIVNHRESLSREESRLVMGEVLSGKCTDSQIAALLVGLHMKGETVEEIVGFAEAIRAAATPIKVRNNSVLDASGTGHEALVDTCGTGGMPLAPLIFRPSRHSWLREPEFVSPSTAIAAQRLKLTPRAQAQNAAQRM